MTKNEQSVLYHIVVGIGGKSSTSESGYEYVIKAYSTSCHIDKASGEFGCDNDGGQFRRKTDIQSFTISDDEIAEINRLIQSNQ